MNRTLDFTQPAPQDKRTHQAPVVKAPSALQLHSLVARQMILDDALDRLTQSRRHVAARDGGEKSR